MFILALEIYWLSLKLMNGSWEISALISRFFSNLKSKRLHDFLTLGSILKLKELPSKGWVLNNWVKLSCIGVIGRVKHVVHQTHCWWKSNITYLWLTVQVISSLAVTVTLHYCDKVNGLMFMYAVLKQSGLCQGISPGKLPKSPAYVQAMFHCFGHINCIILLANSCINAFTNLNPFRNFKWKSTKNLLFHSNARLMSRGSTVQ